MSKAYTVDDLSTLLYSDRTWRIKEISDLKTSIKLATGNTKKSLLRAIVPICYAHWEGSVKYSATEYLKFIALRKMSYDQLHSQFFINRFIPKISNLRFQKTNPHQACDLIERILSEHTKSFSRVNHDLIDTQSNLNSIVLKQICLVCGVKESLFENDLTFIDKFLLRRRNSIAHGEELFIASKDLDDLADRTIRIIRTFSDEVDNLAIQKLYIAA